jgi:hypothetical protein
MSFAIHPEQRGIPHKICEGVFRRARQPNFGVQPGLCIKKQKALQRWRAEQIIIGRTDKRSNAHVQAHQRPHGSHTGAYGRQESGHGATPCRCNANAGTEKAQQFSTTSAIFSSSCLLIAD